MRKFAILITMLLTVMHLSAQHFIGCRTDSGWAETPMLRTSFELEHTDLAPVGHSVTFSLRVVSLGYHEVYLNGTRVGDCVLQPAVSQLDRRALEVTYDITDLVREGDNELMLWIGQGWGRIYGTPAVARAEVEQTVSDGECGLIYILAGTDSTWEASPSPYSYTGSWQPLQFGGECYDARVKERWRPAAVYDAKDITISRQEYEGNHIVNVLSPQSVDTLPDGTLIFDFGRVVTGWFQLDCLPIPEGDSITMEYLDHLDAKPPHTETDIYVSDGTVEDRSRPNGSNLILIGRDRTGATSSSDIHFANRFHMHAFRYVRVKGASVVYARAVQISAVDPAGGATFECSDSRLNAIHDMVKYTLSCLTFSGYMVDCPHIERMGYGGDGNSSTNTLQTLWDVRDVYANWMQAWHDALDSTGDLPYVAPAFRTGGGPYWQGFIVKAPWRTYLNYGDPTLIYRHYDDMCRWMDYIEHHSVDGILQPWGDTERHSWFLADWLAPEGVDIGGESVLHASSCFIAECLLNMEQMAILTGHQDDAERFAERRQLVVDAIHRHFYHPETHSYANGTPLDMAYAMLMDVPPDSATAAAVKTQLIKDIHGKYRDHVAFGLMGTPIFTEWCIREKQADLMATLLRQPDYPGYLNMINQGATTTWESWDCGRPGKEDRSRVHNCYNGIGTWFYQSIAGIRPDSEQPCYKHFFVDPQPCNGIEWVRCTKPTQYGDIRVEITGDKLDVTVPEGTTATVFPGTPNERTLGPGQWKLSIKR
ncbi:MAG: family 78 glycoside hydrolase catalytic domain [Bacteroidales bacterium]|nr:family 78 glycoside hydrolase catalytic domain [Bacteroidales bacterium]